jgi:putative nucleotidyltransferase with HDIG domain
MRWYPPLVALATVSIVVLPAALAAAIVPGGDLTSTAMSALLAAALSLAMASVEAWGWKRWRGSGDVVFADLTLWGCARRWWTGRRLRDLRNSYEAAVATGAPIRIELLEGLSRLLAARSAYTHGHCQRVARHAERIARAMHLPDAEVARIRTAAVVHDVGKIYTPREILEKPGPLTDEELAVMKLHSSDGADMLRSVRDPQLAAIVRHHHERLDGSGYPDSLVGDQIPLGARIVAVADTFDAVTSARPYRGAYSHREGLEILRDEAGSKLDSQAVAAFLERYSSRSSVASLAFVTAISARALTPLGLTSGGLSAAGASLGRLAPTLGAAGLFALAPARAHRPSAPLHRNSSPTLARLSPGQVTKQAHAVSLASTTGTPTRRRKDRQTESRSPIVLVPSGQRVRTPSATASPRAGTGEQPSGSSPAAADSPSTGSSAVGSSSSAGSPPVSSAPTSPVASSPPTTTSPSAPSPPTTTTPGETPALPVTLPVTVSTANPPTVTVSTPVGSVSVHLPLKP